MLMSQEIRPSFGRQQMPMAAGFNSGTALCNDAPSRCDRLDGLPDFRPAAKLNNYIRGQPCIQCSAVDDAPNGLSRPLCLL